MIAFDTREIFSLRISKKTTKPFTFHVQVLNVALPNLRGGHIGACLH